MEKTPVLSRSEDRLQAWIEQTKADPSRLWKRPLWHWLALAGLLLLALWGVASCRTAQAKAAAAAKGGKPPVPVGTVAARLGDMPVYLEGLGSVAAFYTVTLHSRVDGQLMSVAFREGQYVQAGEVLAQIDPRPYQAALDQAAGQLARDQALLGNAKLDLARYQDLLAQNAIPKQQLDTQAATVGQYEGVVKNDQASVEAAKLNLTYARITAPISGRVGLRLVDPGNIVHANDPNGLVVITQLQPIAVVFTLPEDNLPALMARVRSGERLSALAYNRDKSQLLATGALQTVDNQIDPQTGTLKLKAVFDNKDSTLFPNQFVNVRLLLETRHDQAIVPAVAVQRGTQGTFVYVVKADGTAEARPVKVAVSEGGNVALEGAVADGEAVVVDGAEAIQPGSHVRVDAPAGAPAAGSGPAHRGKKGI